MTTTYEENQRYTWCPGIGKVIYCWCSVLNIVLNLLSIINIYVCTKVTLFRINVVCKNRFPQIAWMGAFIAHGLRGALITFVWYTRDINFMIDMQCM